MTAETNVVGNTAKADSYRQQVQETMNSKTANTTDSLYLERLLGFTHALCLA